LVGWGKKRWRQKKEKENQTSFKGRRNNQGGKESSGEKNKLSQMETAAFEN